MTTRILPVEEWPRLDGTLLDPSWRTFEPENVRVVVIEHEGRIVGCTAFLKVWHVEGTWVAVEHRGKAGVLRRLIRAAKALCLDLRTREVWMMTHTPETAALCRRFGSVTPLTCDHFAVMME